MEPSVEPAPARSELVVEAWRPEQAAQLVPAESGVPRARHAPRVSRVLTLLIVGVIHVFVWQVFAHLSVARQSAAQSRADPIEVRFFDLPAISVPVAEPAVAVAALEIEIAMPDSLPIAIEDPAGIRSLEPPRLDSTGLPELGAYSARAALPNGQIATVVVMVEVAADGNVISAEVVRSTGNELANEVAMAYARDAKWIPGSVQGVPRPMKASLTVILGSGERLAAS
jgi:TonB family protein